MALTEGTRLGSYVIAARIGAGGMGEVYRARDTRLGRDVAIKTLPYAVTTDPERLARLEREARMLARAQSSEHRDASRDRGPRRDPRAGHGVGRRTNAERAHRTACVPRRQAGLPTLSPSPGRSPTHSMRRTSRT